jgi:hypothetical protein
MKVFQHPEEIRASERSLTTSPRIWRRHLTFYFTWLTWINLRSIEMSSNIDWYFLASCPGRSSLVFIGSGLNRGYHRANTLGRRRCQRHCHFSIRKVSVYPWTSPDHCRPKQRSLPVDGPTADSGMQTAAICFYNSKSFSPDVLWHRFQAASAMILTCKHPYAHGEDKLPCIVTLKDVTRQKYLMVNRRRYDPISYQQMYGIQSKISCMLLCFMNDRLAFMFNAITELCWCHVTRPICIKRKRRPLSTGSSIFVKKVSNYLRLAPVRHPACDW